MRTYFLSTLAACAALLSANAALAHTDHSGPATPAPHSTGHAHNGMPATASEQQPWGKAGHAAQVQRTIHLRMTDDMRFAPAHFQVQQGETVRLLVDNAGQLQHEIVLGTPATLDAHAQAMLQHPGMAHSEAFMAHVPAQQQGELVWTFNRPGRFDFACLIAGHYQSGMRGTVTVTPQ